MQRFIRQGAFNNEVHFCQFGEKWRKATFLLAWNLSDFASIVRICGGIPGIAAGRGTGISTLAGGMLQGLGSHESRNHTHVHFVIASLPKSSALY